MELSSVSKVQVDWLLSLFSYSLKATSPRDSLAVITPGVEEHLTVAVEGEIHPVENIYSQHLLILSPVWPDLPPPALDEVPHCPGLWLTEGWCAPVLLTARVAAASWKCTLTTFIFIWSWMRPNLSQALCYLYWQFFCQRYIASFIDTRVGPLQTNGERIYLFLQSSKNNCSKIFNTHLFLPTWSWSSC